MGANRGSWLSTLIVKTIIKLRPGAKIVDNDGNTLVDENGVTVADVITTPITGFVSGAGTVGATDTILQAINKLDGNVAAKLPLAGGTLTGDVTGTGFKANNGGFYLVNSSYVAYQGNEKPVIFYGNGSGSYPFSEGGNLIIQGRTTATAPRDIIFATGDTNPLMRFAITRTGGASLFGNASTEGYGALTLKALSASKAFAGGGTEVIPVQVPSGAKIVGCLLRNDTTLVATTGVSYSAAYSTGSTQAIGTGIDYVKNTKTSTFFDVNAATDITSGLTDVTLTPNAGTLDTGTVTAVVFYYELTALTSAA